MAQLNDNFLKRDHTQFKINDSIILLEGVNLGNWLNFEPYLLNAPTFVASSNEQLAQAITSLTGDTSIANTFFAMWRSTFIQKKDIDSITSMGFNHVRIPFSYTLFYNDSLQQLTNEGFNYLDSVVLWCKQNNILTILDLHVAPGGQNNSALWNNYNLNKSITTNIWKHIALHYKTETTIGGYDVLNEPVITDQNEQWKLKDLYQSITNEIRSVDTNHLLFFEGNWYASSFWELTDGTPSSNDRWDENMAFSQHVYWVPQPSSTNFWTHSIASAMDIPSWCGEGGENSNHWLNEWVNDCVNQNSSWCLWTYKKAGGISSIYSNPFNSKYLAILNYWNGGPQPSTNTAIEGLLDFAQQTDLSSCFFRKDVKDAVIRNNFSTTPIPYQLHTLPTTIYAVNYDMGANGIGSFDSEFQSTGQGANFTNYNSGWSIRNDGVDIETWTGYPTIGNIAVNEWFNYTTQVPQSATYKVSIEYAAPFAGAKVELHSNNIAILPEIELPATGGWGSWQFFELGTLSLIGNDTIRFKLLVTANGLNLKALKFELIDSLFNSTSFMSSTNLKLNITPDNITIISPKYIYNVELISANGTTVYTKKNHEKTNNLQIPWVFEQGVYFLKLIYHDSIEEIIKIIKN